MKKYKNLNEALRLSDLMKDAGISDFTKKFKKERSKIMGSESKVAKLLDVKINEKEDYVDFIWLTESTKKYPPDFKNMELNKKLNLIPDPSKTYTIIIRILDFFSLLKTSPDEITNKDIEDVIKVANIKIWDSTPSFQYQGGNFYISSEFAGSIYPTDIAPTDKMNKNGTVIGWKSRMNQDIFLSKNSQALINNIFFFVPQMRQKIKSELKKMGIV